MKHIEIFAGWVPGVLNFTLFYDRKELGYKRAKKISALASSSIKKYFWKKICKNMHSLGQN